jgi:hypothetical protein
MNRSQNRIRLSSRHRRVTLADAKRRRGQSLLEFALVSMVIYVLLAGILTFGHALYVAQGLQAAVDVGAREISRTPINVSVTSLDDDTNDDSGAIWEADVRERIFDEAYLVIDLDELGGNFFLDAVPQMPLLNQQLATMMIVDRPVINGVQRRFLRYPGALLTRDSAFTHPSGRMYDSWVATGFTVGIPVVRDRSATGTETIEWRDVVEEIEPQDEMDDCHDPFRISSAHRGIVALRINYPFQSASMSSFQPSPGGPFEPTETLNKADDAGVTELKPGERPGGLTGAPVQWRSVRGHLWWTVRIGSPRRGEKDCQAVSPRDFCPSDLSPRGF